MEAVNEVDYSLSQQPTLFRASEGLGKSQEERVQSQGKAANGRQATLDG